MKNSNLKQITITLLATITLIISSFSKKETEIPKVENRGGIYYLEITAPTPYGKGFQQGAALKEVIKESIEDFNLWITDHSSYKNSKEMAKDFISKTNYLDDVKEYTPNLYAELQGMAKGSEVDLEVLFLYNSLDEYLAFLMEQGANADQIAHCTTTGVYGRTDLPNIVTHNNDLMTIFRNRVVVTKIKDSKSDVVILQTGFAGTFAQNGVNNYGVGVGCNIIVDMERNHRGLPVAFNNRKILETKSIQEAKKYLTNVPSAQSMNYMVGDRNRVESLEVSGHGNVFSVNNYNGNYAVHTNHTLNSDAKKVRDITSKKPTTAKTLERLETAEKILANEFETIDIQGIKNLKSTTPIRIKEEGAISETIESVICEIPKQGNPILYVTNGLPNGDNYERFDF